jgi:predicted lipoprotein with Yx(FWY)xxD motif
MQRKLALVLSLSAAAGLVVGAAALSGTDGGHPAGTPASTAIDHPFADTPFNRRAAPYSLSTIESPLGTIIVDASGYPLYRFDESGKPVADRRTDPRVDPLPERRTLTCDGGAPPDWQPVAYVYNTSLTNIDDSLLGYLQRADGRLQLTIRGCPLYRYAGDRVPGQVNGHGIAGVWFAVTPDGTNATIPGNSTSTPITSGDAG